MLYMLNLVWMRGIFDMGYLYKSKQQGLTLVTTIIRKESGQIKGWSFHLEHISKCPTCEHIHRRTLKDGHSKKDYGLNNVKTELKILLANEYHDLIDGLENCEVFLI